MNDSAAVCSKIEDVRRVLEKLIRNARERLAGIIELLGSGWYVISESMAGAK